jgi:hypothetical protein
MRFLAQLKIVSFIHNLVLTKKRVHPTRLIGLKLPVNYLRLVNDGVVVVQSQVSSLVIEI